MVNNATAKMNSTASYRIPIAVQFAWSLILFCGMLMLPETPRYLIKAGHMDKASHALGRIRRLPSDHSAIEEELAEIKAIHEFEMSIGKSSYLDCFKPPILKRQFTGCALQALQQLTGINFIFVSLPCLFMAEHMLTCCSITEPSTSKTRACPAASSSP